MMDAKKLAALVEEHSKNPLSDMPTPEAEEDNPEEGMDMLGRGEELLTSMGEFGEELKESADIIVDNAIDIGEDLASEEPSPDTEEAAQDMADGMPGFMHEGFVEEISGKDRKDLEAIGTALDHAVESDTPQGEHTEETAAKVGGLLEMIGKCCEEGTHDEDNPGEDDEEPSAEMVGDELENPGY